MRIWKSEAADLTRIFAVINEAAQAIDFYRRSGFTVLPVSDKERRLRTYWSIPERQVETSVVLADRRWMEAQRPAPLA